MKNISDLLGSFTRFIKNGVDSPFLPAVFLLGLCLVTYFPTLQSSFKFDDFTHIDLKPQSFGAALFSLFAKSSTQHYNPLDPLLNNFLFRTWGQNVVPFHVLNIALFYFNLLCLLKIALLLTESRWISLSATILFAIHPLNAEIINQIVFNSVLLSALFFQLSFIFYDRYLNNTKLRDILAAILFAFISFLSLETSWILPWYLFCWAYFYKKKDFKVAIATTLPFWVITIALFLLWRSLCAASSLSGGILQRFEYLMLSLGTFTGSLAYLALWYVSKLFIPLNHVWIYSIAPLSAFEAKTACLILIVFVLAIFFLVSRVFQLRSNYFAVIWFVSSFIFLLPGSLAHPESGLVVEPYWFYISSMGFFIIAAIFLDVIKNRVSQNLFMILILGICGALFLATQRFNAIAKTEKSYSQYWMGIVISPMPLNALANIALQEKEYRKALDYYALYLRRFSFSPYAFHPAQAIYTKLSLIYLEMGEISKAKQMINEAFKIKKNYLDAIITSGFIALKEKDYSQAEKEFLSAVEIDAQNILSHLNLVDIYHATGQDIKAIEILKFLIGEDLNRNDRRNIYARLAVLEFIYGDFEQSFQRVSQLLAKDPSADSFGVVAKNFKKFNLNEPAEIILEQGIKMYPKSKDLHLLLGEIKKKILEKNKSE